MPKFKKKESQEDLLPEELSEMIESAVDTPEKPKEAEIGRASCRERVYDHV